MKKLGYIIVSIAIIIVSFVGCTGKKAENAFNENKKILVLNRESGSGTKISLLNFLELSESDLLEDNILSGTDVMLAAVENEPYAIGYLSLSNLTSDVKALSIDKISPKLQSIEDGSYPFTRDFYLVTRSKTTDVVQDFISYILTRGDLIEDMGYVALGNSSEYIPINKDGEIKISGSSSIYPLMLKLTESYKEINPKVNIEITQTDSSSGIANVKDDIVHIAMSSRMLTQQEVIDTNHIAIAKDTIAVIVNAKNPTDDISFEELKNIYTGSLRFWNEVK